MKTDSLLKNQLIVRNICSYAAIWEKLMSKLKKEEKFLWNQNAKRFETLKDSNSLITSLCIKYRREFMALNQEDPMFCGGFFFYKLTLQLIKLNIPTNDWFHFLHWGGTGVFISGIVNPIINSVKFLFWVSTASCFISRYLVRVQCYYVKYAINFLILATDNILRLP